MASSGTARERITTGCFTKMDAQRRLPINGASNVKPNGNQDSSSMSRAEKFEDEKQRIIDSLFAKREQDGACKVPS